MSNIKNPSRSTHQAPLNRPSDIDKWVVASRKDQATFLLTAIISLVILISTVLAIV